MGGIFMEENNLKHKVVLNNKNDLFIEGVKTIDSFDSSEFLIETVMGYMHITGKGLTLGKMDNDREELTIKGIVSKIEYVSNSKEKNTGLLKNIFK
jgi:sporulation protein YabP